MQNWIASALQSVMDVSNVLNASAAASWLVLVVIMLRFLLKKVPKGLHVALWGLVAVRLLMPISIESGFSLLPSAEIVTKELLQAGPVPGAQPAYLEIVSNPSYGREITVELDRSIGSFQWDLLGITFVWLAGIAILAAYTTISYWRLCRKVDTAVRYRENIFRSEQAASPFVLGVFRPKIFLPFTMDGQALEYVVAHEQAHIRRRDHWWKPLGFLLLTVHWFNPLMWLAYVLLCRDIELACDEKVIKDLGNDQRADYSRALVVCSVNRRVLAASPLAFGEVGVKARVKSVMQYRKPTFWMVVLAILMGIAVAVCFLTNPMDPGSDLSFLDYKNAISVAADRDEMVAIYCPSSDDGSDASIQIGAASGADLAKQLERWNWKACKPPREALPSPGSVEFVIEEAYRITVHQKKSGAFRQYAVVKYGDAVQYYKIHRSDYPDAVALVYAPSGSVAYSDADSLICYAESEGNNAYIDPKYYENGFDWDYDRLAWGQMYSSGKLVFTANWDPEELVVGENYYERTSPTSVMIHQKTHTLTKNSDGNFELEVEYKNPGTDEMAFYFIRGETGNGKYVMKIVFGEDKYDDPAEPEVVQDQLSYFLTVGEANVKTIAITELGSSGGCENADGTTFQKGERVWLEPLDGKTNLQGVTITAKDANGYDLFSVRVSDYYDPANPDAPIVCGEWILTSEYH